MSTKIFDSDGYSSAKRAIMISSTILLISKNSDFALNSFYIFGNYVEVDFLFLQKVFVFAHILISINYIGQIIKSKIFRYEFMSGAFLIEYWFSIFPILIYALFTAVI